MCQLSVRNKYECMAGVAWLTLKEDMTPTRGEENNLRIQIVTHQGTKCCADIQAINNLIHQMST